MQYTPQQLAGAGKYSSGVRIGNWNEDVEVEENRLKEFLSKKERGELMVLRTQHRFAQSLQPVELKNESDGYIHWGDTVMIANEKTQGFMAIDLADKIKSSNELFGITATTLCQSPVARNTFIIERCEDDKIFGETETLVYGQKFRIRSHPLLLPDKTLYFYSHPLTPTQQSKYSYNQEVAFSPEASWSTVWKVQYADPDMALEMEGEPVPANAAVVLMHCGTHVPLAADLVIARNDFGIEFEMCCKKFLDMYKKEMAENRFCFVNAIGEGGDAGGDAPKE